MATLLVKKIHIFTKIATNMVLILSPGHFSYFWSKQFDHYLAKGICIIPIFKAIGGPLINRKWKKNVLPTTMPKCPIFKGILSKIDKNNV